MNQHEIERALADLPIPSVRYAPVIDSTNDEASRWADRGAPDLSLVIADEQTAGRGRAGRRWYTPPGSALAFSLVIYPPDREAHALQQLTALGALAVQRTLKECYLLPAQIKWPNDVLIDRFKVAGILAEAHWMGDRLTNTILGIGINIASPSAIQVSAQISETSLPVTCLQDAVGKPVDRLMVLHDVLKELLVWLPRLGTPAFMHAWEDALAFRDEWVIIDRYNENSPATREDASPPVLQGKIRGLAEDGGLILQLPAGDTVMLYNGDVRMRPVA
jgi:BirA family biotin operon repressor/biotin-[acetyl-CoA-carboxylase] ligase